MNTWPKQCGCGRAYFPGEWTSLPWGGYQEDGAGGRLDLRHCTCGSTIAVEVEAKGLPWTLAWDLADVFHNDARDLEGLPPPYAWPPQPRREVSPEDAEEANRLHDIADALGAQSAVGNPDENEDEAA